VAIQGYWRSALKSGNENSDGIFTCPHKRSHRAYCWDFSPCLPGEACEGDNVCKKGYTEDKCAHCCDWNFAKLEDGSKNPNCFDDVTGEQFLYHRIYGKCEECPDNIGWILFGTFLALIFFGLVGRRLQRKKVDLAIFSIGVDYFQVLAIFASTEVEWPNSVQMIFRYMSLFNFSINITPPECVFEVSYRTKWFWIQWFPTVLFASVAIIFSSSMVYFRYCSSHNTKLMREVRNKIVAGSLLTMYILYLNISENTLDPLNCNFITADDGMSTKLQYMTSQPSEVCWQKDKYTLQQELVPYAWAFFIFYTLGYPALVAAILVRNAPKCINDQYLRCLGTGNKKETNKAYFNFRSKYATLYFKFKPKLYYWMLFIILRKLCIVTFTLLFHVNATMQLSMILLVVFLSYTMQVKHNPYLSRSDYAEIVGAMEEEEYLALVGPFGVCPQPKGIGYETLLQENDTKATVSSRMSFGAAVERMRQGGFSRDDLKKSGEAALKFAFDMNTVESTLLFSAILICLFGIMFSSEFSTSGDILYERLGELTLATITMSLSYYFVVVWVEVIAVMFPSLAFSFLSDAIDVKKDAFVETDGTVVIGGEEEDEVEIRFQTQTVGMDDHEKDAFRLRLLDREVVYRETNPIMVRQMEADLAAKAVRSAQEDEQEVFGQTLLGLEQQMGLQDTVKSLMEEIKVLKKKVAIAGQQATSIAHGPVHSKIRSKLGGQHGNQGKMSARREAGDETKGSVDTGALQSKSPMRGRSSKRGQSPKRGLADDEVDLNEVYGATSHQATGVVRLGGTDKPSDVDVVAMSSNPLSRGRTGGGGGAGIIALNPMASCKKNGGPSKSVRMAQSAFDDEGKL
jgi:hypothetical protein